jgi:hypothetical protein
MRVLLGLSALAAVNGQLVTPNGPASGSPAAAITFGQTALTSIVARLQTSSGALVGSSGSSSLLQPAIPSGLVNSNNFFITVPTQVTAISFDFVTNTYTGQIQYRWSPGYVVPSGFTANAYKCDSCAGGTWASCNTAVGPVVVGVSTTGFPCANLARNFIFSGLVSTQLNNFAVNLYDLNTTGSTTSSYSFQVTRLAPAVIVGDPQIVGMQGQDFQVHGMPDEIFNVVSYPSLQVNARFTYLESGDCHDNFTACFAHPGTYISEEGFRVGVDKVRVIAGSFKKGLTVTVNGKKVHNNVDLKSGAVQVVNHRRVVVHTEIMKITVSNSDHFLNQELELMDDKLVSLGSTRKVLKDNQRFHPEVPLHGLQGQTWRNVEYPSGLEYEGSIMDYHVVDGNIFGTDFVFNQFSS